MNRNITSKNASVVFMQKELFPAGFKAEQMASDAAFSEGEETISETRRTFDGKLVAGAVSGEIAVTYTFEPTSPTVPYFNTIIKATKKGNIYPINCVVSLPGIKKVRNYINGYITACKGLPDGGQTLGTVTVSIAYEDAENQEL